MPCLSEVIEIKLRAEELVAKNNKADQIVIKGLIFIADLIRNSNYLIKGHTLFQAQKN